MNDKDLAIEKINEGKDGEFEAMRQAYEQDVGQGQDDDSNDDQDALKDLLSRINDNKNEGVDVDDQANQLQLNDLHDASDTENLPEAKDIPLAVI